ncbi:MAG: biotin transporter BioY [Chloroflexi bacterium]|nr:biotin transporter BioY [Chloroflexota bacterium]
MNSTTNLKTLSSQLNKSLWLRIAVVVVFAAITALSARITINLPFTPVPITLQPLAVVLSGLVLGARSGAAAQLVYLGLIAAGLPLDARGLGPAAFFGPTAGYLLGFVPAAFVSGWLAERFSGQSWWGNFLAAIAGMAGGVAPFILLDLVKAVIAASVAESGKILFLRQ